MAEALASSFLGKIGDILLEKIGYFVIAPIGRQFTYVCCFNSNIKKLETQSEELERTLQWVQRSVVADKSNLRDIDPNVEAWLEKANKVLTEVEGIIQEYLKVEKTTSLLAERRLCTSTLPQIPQEPRVPGLPFFNPGVKEGCVNGGWCRNLKLSYSRSRKVVKKTNAILELKVDSIAYTKSLSHSPTPACSESIPKRDFEDFVSRKDKMEVIMEALRHREINLIGISGLPGVGKTKMVQEVGRKTKEENLFDEVGFVPVGQVLDLTKVQNCVAENFGLLKLKKYDDALTRATLLRKRLSQDKKRILLILDDIWENFDLEDKGIPLESASETFTFLYTSRKEGLWNEVPTKMEIALEPLSDKEAWQLFSAKAGDLADAPQLISTAQKIVNKCGSLPLALVIIGGLLSYKRSKTSKIDRGMLDPSTIDRWEEMLNRLNRTTAPADEELFSKLKLSYNYLEEEAKKLFLLCCLFEEDKSVCVEDLAKYTLGLSLFDGLRTMREVKLRVAALVDDLKRCYLLLDGDYGHESVKVHDVVRYMGIHVASKSIGALVSHGVASDWPKKDTYENCTAISLISEKITKLPEGLKCQDLKFLLLQCRKLKELPGNFFEGMDKLKVLELRDFHGIGILGLQYLRNLTMLSLEGFGGKLDNIVVITDLKNLEILSFRGSWIKELPEEVGKLVKLRLLDLITKARMRILPNVISCLECLEELYIGDNYVDPREFGPNLQIIQIDKSIERVPSVLANAQDDAVHLNRAFAGWSCDETTIVNILAHRSSIRRALIRQEYEKKFSEVFDNRLSKELMLSPDLKRALLLWMDDPASRDAKLVKHGLSGNHNVAIEVICSRTPSQIEQLKKDYLTMFGAHLEDDIESHAASYYKKLLLAYIRTPRSEGEDEMMVDKDVKALFNEEAFIRIFSERSWAHLATVNSAYNSMYANSLKEVIMKETCGNFKCALLTILQCAENPRTYFAEALHKAMDGHGTDDETLTRIIVSRAEVDIEKVKSEYLMKYGKSLSDGVHSKTSGHYRAFLLSLVNMGNVGPLEFIKLSTKSVPLNTVESTERAPPEVTSEATESVPPHATTLSLTSVRRESIVESTKSVHLEVTSESTGSGSSEVTTKPTEGVVPRDVTNSSIASAPSSNPPQATPTPNASAPSLGLTSGTPDDQELTTKARDDAIHLNGAFAGWGCNEATVVKILAHRSARHRTLIRQEYKTKFSQDFDNRLSQELFLKPDLKRALLLWMDEPANRDAKLVKHGLSKNLNAAIEVICSRTPSQLEELKKAYRTLFGVYLDEDIESHAHSDNKKLLVAYAGTPHSESLEVDAVMVDKDAKDLFKDGQWRLGTNEETFIRIFSERSGAHLAAINSAYRKMYVNSLKKAVKKETSSKFKCALLTILKCAENPGKYFAKALHKAIAGLGTDDETLTRIIVSRAEVDIEKIKAEYLKKYGKSLSADVHDDTSGHYRAFLLSLLDPNA